MFSQLESLVWDFFFNPADNLIHTYTLDCSENFNLPLFDIHATNFLICNMWEYYILIEPHLRFPKGGVWYSLIYECWQILLSITLKLRHFTQPRHFLK